MRAIKPNLAVVTSGVSPVAAGLAPVAGDSAGEVVAVGVVEGPQPCKIAAPAAVIPAVTINLRLERLLIG